MTILPSRHGTGRTFRFLTGLAIVLGLTAKTWGVGPSPPPQFAPTPQAQVPAGPQPGPDSRVQPGVPTGEVIKGEFDKSAVYPGSWREYWVYVPAGLDRSRPAPVMVFQDGIQYNAPVVFDNLIHRKAIPPIVGVFVMHGRVKAPSS
jgi:enterochelin esterase-like enzyme